MADEQMMSGQAKPRPTSFFPFLLVAGLAMVMSGAALAIAIAAFTRAPPPAVVGQAGAQKEEAEPLVMEREDSEEDTAGYEEGHTDEGDINVDKNEGSFDKGAELPTTATPLATGNMTTEFLLSSTSISSRRELIFLKL